MRIRSAKSREFLIQYSFEIRLFRLIDRERRYLNMENVSLFYKDNQEEDKEKKQRYGPIL